MKRSLTAYILILLVCWGLTSSARATIVDANDEWYMPLDPGESITCISYFIPNIPNIPDSLIFAQAPQWTGTYPFDYNSYGWDTALADGGKTAYLFGPELTNNGTFSFFVFSYELFYQWDDEDPYYDPNSPVYLDVVVFDDDTIISDSSRWGKPDSYDQDDVTWREQNGDPPYENPVPEPMTVGLLGLGSAVLFIRKRRPAFR